MGVNRWYVYGGQCSTIVELDDNNNMTTSGQFDVYGLPRTGTQQGGAAMSSQGYVGSLGHVTDQSTGGLIYMQARYYDPSLGRFVSEDPDKCEANWYVYTGDNPVNMSDRTGRDFDALINQILQNIIKDPKGSYNVVMWMLNTARNMIKGRAAQAAAGSEALVKAEAKDGSGNEFAGKAEELAGAVALQGGVGGEVEGIVAQEDIELTLELDFGDADDGGQQVMDFE